MWHLGAPQSNCRLPIASLLHKLEKCSHSLGSKSTCCQQALRHFFLQEMQAQGSLQLFSCSQPEWQREDPRSFRELEHLCFQQQWQLEVFICDCCKIGSGEIVHNNCIRLHIGLFTWQDSPVCLTTQTFAYYDRCSDWQVSATPWKSTRDQF